MFRGQSRPAKKLQKRKKLLKEMESKCGKCEVSLPLMLSKGFTQQEQN